MLVDEWEIFNELSIARDFLAACCEPYHPRHNPGPDPFDPHQPVGEEELFFDVESPATFCVLPCAPRGIYEASIPRRSQHGSNGFAGPSLGPHLARSRAG